jgi:biotin synthase
MEMFEMLGLTPQNHLQKFLSLLQLKLRALNLPLGEKPKWSRPGHTIEKILKHQLKENNISSL